MINVNVYNYEGGQENLVREIENVSMSGDTMAEKIATAIFENKALMLTGQDGIKHVFGPEVLKKSYVEILPEE